MRIAGLIDICVLSTWASHAHGACVSLQSHSPFAPSLQTFPIRERVRVHPRVYVCIIYGDTKDKFWDCLIWKQNIQAKKVSSRHKLVISFKGMGERSIYIFKSCHRSTIRNVQGIMMSRALFDLIPVMRVSCLHIMLSRFLLVFKMSVLDIIRETASFLASEVCLENGKRDCER